MKVDGSMHSSCSDSNSSWKLERATWFYVRWNGNLICLSVVLDMKLRSRSCVRGTLDSHENSLLPLLLHLIAQTMDDGHGRQIYHVAILVKTPSGVRYITHSNGIHYTQRHSAPICTCGLDLWCISTNHLTRLQHGSTGGEIALFLFSNISRSIFIGTFAGLIRERREEERSKRR